MHNLNETWSKLPTHEWTILTKFQQDWAKIVDFLNNRDTFSVGNFILDQSPCGPRHIEFYAILIYSLAPIPAYWRSASFMTSTEEDPNPYSNCTP